MAERKTGKNIRKKPQEKQPAKGEEPERPKEESRDPDGKGDGQLPSEPFFVVGLGASAGGLETLEQFFTNMPPDSGMAFVVVVHLDPTHKTMLPELLARFTRMEVCLAEEGVRVRPDTVYVIPANRDLTLDGGQLHLEEPLAPRGMRHTIDVFFRSLAADMEEYAIAVILSGTGTDGTQGVKAVKEAGGIVVVQEEGSARYPGMPQSATATGVADLVIPVQKMPDKILEMVSRSHLLVGKGGQEPARKVADRLRTIFRIVHTRTGHDFSSYKVSTIMRRIERRMAVNDVAEVDDYIALLNDRPEEARALFKEILIGVTSFFRDPEAFEALRERVIPQIFKDRDPDDPVRIWLAGCATGEEAYSVAILLREYARDHRIEPKIQVFATDIDEMAIEAGRAGIYPDSISADVSPERLRLFFRKVDSTYQVVKPLREMIVFAQHNVIKDPPFGRLDLLVCRNLLIYLNPEIQKRLIPLFFQAIQPNGFLFLGTSETVGSHTDLFRPLDKKWKIFHRQATGRRVGVEFPLSAPKQPVPERKPAQAGFRDEGISPGILAEKTLMQRYSPPCVVINEKCEVVYFSTRTSRFLEPPVGEPSQDILKMAKDDLRPALRAAIHKALTDQEPVLYKGLKITTDKGEDTLDLRVEPINDPASAKGLAMVVFEPRGSRAPLPPPPAEREEKPLGDESTKDVMIRQLEEQLQITHEQLQSTIESLETSNEELKSSNEELMSMNEEFQSTNEELETSKEELQALNEELVTVNAELESKVDELGQANNDMENLLNSSDIAIIFLDRQLRIKRYSPAMGKIFNLIHSDLGRPLQHISGRIDYPGLERDAEQVLEDLSPVEREVSTAEGDRSYLMRVLPYRTMENVIDGVVVTFIDFSERKKAEEARARLAAIVESTDVAIIGKELDGTITSWNRGAERIYGYTAEEVVGGSISLLIPADKSEEFGEIMGKVRKGQRFNQIETVRRRKDGSEIIVSLTVSPIFDNRKYVIGASSVARDITDRKDLEKALRQTAEREQEQRAEVEAILEAVPAAVLISHDPECRVITGNRAAYDLLRVEPGSNTSKSNPESPVDHFRVLHDGREVPPSDLPVQRVAATGKPILNYEEEVLFDDGARICAFGNAVPLLDEKGKPAGAVAAFVNITPRVRAEEALRKAKRAAEAANEAKSAFLATMSHELRTPLTGILGVLELLAHTALSDEQKKYQQMAQDSGHALLRLINDVLDFSKVEAGKLEIVECPFDLRTCVQSAVHLMDAEAEKKNLELTLDFPSRLKAQVRGDCDRLHQVLFNLVGNAIKFTEKGKIRVSVEEEPAGKGKKGGSRMFRFSVADTGIGIPAAKLEHIFDRFTQVDNSFTRSYSGTGLGLAISRKLVESMGGALEVTSEEGRGSTFSFTLPLAVLSAGESKEGASCTVPADRPAASPGGPRVLVAEDDPMISQLLRMILDQKKWDHRIVDRGDEALAAWEEEDFDIIFMDVRMPDMDGFETVRLLREREEKQGTHTPVIALTAHAQEEYRDRCLAAGMDGYISKPIDINKLFSQVEKLVK